MRTIHTNDTASSCLSLNSVEEIMKKALIIGVLLASTSTIASAAGINMSWQDCGTGGTANRTFACNTNAGVANDLWLSFDPPHCADPGCPGGALPAVVGVNTSIDLQSLSPNLTAWWQFKNTATCRLASLLAPGALVSVSGTCADTWQSGDAPGIAAYLTSANSGLGPNRARILGSNAVGSALAAQTAPGTEYYAMTVRINNAKTVGTACPGCNDPVSMTLNEVLIGQQPGTPGESPLVTTARDNNCVSWQGGIPNGCLATPTRNRTWGQVKSLYR